MHRCLVTNNDIDISTQVFEISVPSNAYGNTCISAYKIIQELVCPKTKRTTRCVQIIQA
jgi:hypothetical protein